jgi:class 3 adenylate cyclase
MAMIMPDPMGSRGSSPLPDAPALAAVASSLRDAGQWGEVVDADWRVVYLSDDLRLSYGLGQEFVDAPLGMHIYGADAMDLRLSWPAGPIVLEACRASLAALGPWMLADSRGGRDELIEVLDPRLRDVLDGVPASASPPARSVLWRGLYRPGGPSFDLPTTWLRVHDADGRLAGAVGVSKPGPGMHALATLAATADERHLALMQQVANADRRPAALLFADLERSSALAKKLPTASYFALGRRLIRAADERIIGGGGLPGRHVGDGVAAFFLAAGAGSESAAARSCVEAARGISQALPEIAVHSGLRPDELVMRFGLHWGAGLYVGQIATSGRVEVTGLGEEVNEGSAYRGVRDRRTDARLESPARASAGRGRAGTSAPARPDEVHPARPDSNGNREGQTGRAGG